MALLETRSMSVSFGGLKAVNDIDIEVPQGKIVGLIGPNGAGKTTCFNAICGVIRPSSGSIHLQGRDISRLPTHKRARRGLGRTFQRLEVFASLSVRDNVSVGLEIRRSWARRSGASRQFLTDNPQLPSAAEVELILERLNLLDLAEVPVGALPTGQARLVELGRALAARPSVLLLDEPASGLDDNETSGFGHLLLELAESGLGILLVEHDVALVMDVCTHLNVLDFGQVIASGDPAVVRSDTAVEAAYLGTSSS